MKFRALLLAAPLFATSFAFSADAPLVISTSSPFVTCVSQQASKPAPAGTPEATLSYVLVVNIGATAPNISTAEVSFIGSTGELFTLDLTSDDQNGWQYVQLSTGEIGAYAYNISPTAQLKDQTGTVLYLVDLSTCAK